MVEMPHLLEAFRMVHRLHLLRQASHQALVRDKVRGGGRRRRRADGEAAGGHAGPGRAQGAGSGAICAARVPADAVVAVDVLLMAAPALGPLQQPLPARHGHARVGPGRPFRPRRGRQLPAQVRPRRGAAARGRGPGRRRRRGLHGPPGRVPQGTQEGAQGPLQVRRHRGAFCAPHAGGGSQQPLPARRTCGSSRWRTSGRSWCSWACRGRTLPRSRAGTGPGSSSKWPRARSGRTSWAGPSQSMRACPARPPPACWVSAARWTTLRPGPRSGTTSRGCTSVRGGCGGLGTPAFCWGTRGTRPN
jgi:hypothetical protein